MLFIAKSETPNFFYHARYFKANMNEQAISSYIVITTKKFVDECDLDSNLKFVLILSKYCTLQVFGCNILVDFINRQNFINHIFLMRPAILNI